MRHKITITIIKMEHRLWTYVTIVFTNYTSQEITTDYNI